MSQQSKIRSKVAKKMTWGITTAYRESPSRENPIAYAPIPSILVLPLHQSTGSQAKSLVTTGDKVLRGQPLAEAPPQTLGATVHAPTSGTVAAVERRPVAGKEAHQECIVIATDGKDTPFIDQRTANENHSLSPEEIREGIAAAGIVGFGGAMFPTAFKLNPASSIELLILNGVECEPFIDCDNLLLRERAAEVIRGAQFMMQALETERGIVAIKDDMPRAVEATRNALLELADKRITLMSVPASYPAGGERQLIEYLTGLEVPSGGLPWDIGIACQNVATAAATYRFFHDGEPVISRIVTVTGSGVKHPQNVETRIGTLAADLINFAGGYINSPSRLIMGGPMMGHALPDDQRPITKASNCLIAGTDSELQADTVERPCIRCGDCAQACPARLMPQNLLGLSREGSSDELQSQGLLDCIECGCCDYVCPSSIPLTQHFVQAKRRVWEEQLKQQKAHHAKQRFEAHNQRLADEEKRRVEQLRTQTDTVSAETISALLERANSEKD